MLACWWVCSPPVCAVRTHPFTKALQLSRPSVHKGVRTNAQQVSVTALLATMHDACMAAHRDRRAGDPACLQARPPGHTRLLAMRLCGGRLLLVLQHAVMVSQIAKPMSQGRLQGCNTQPVAELHGQSLQCDVPPDELPASNTACDPATCATTPAAVDARKRSMPCQSCAGSGRPQGSVLSACQQTHNLMAACQHHTQHSLTHTQRAFTHTTSHPTSVRHHHPCHLQTHASPQSRSQKDQHGRSSRQLSTAGRQQQEAGRQQQEGRTGQLEGMVQTVRAAARTAIGNNECGLGSEQQHPTAPLRRQSPRTHARQRSAVPTTASGPLHHSRQPGCCTAACPIHSLLHLHLVPPPLPAWRWLVLVLLYKPSVNSSTA